MPQKGRTPPPPPADARRIRAALAAVEGISTERLETGDVRLVLDNLPKLHETLGVVYVEAANVCTVPDGVAQLRTALASVYRAVGKMCDGTDRPHGQVPSVPEP